MGTKTGSAPQLLDKRAAAAFLSVSVSTLDRLRRRRQLMAVRIGGQIRYDRDDLLAFIDDAREG